MYTFNGTGTKLFGNKKIDNEEYSISTKWFSVFFLPVIPLKSFKVKTKNITSGLLFMSTTKELEIIPIEFQLKQVLLTYLKTLFLGPILTLYILYIISEFF